MSIPEVLEQNKKISLLRNVYLFSALSEQKLQWLVGKLRTQEFEPGENIIAEGDSGDQFYIIKRGEVQIMKNGGVIRTIGELEFFGE